MVITQPLPLVETRGPGLAQNIAATFGLPDNFADMPREALPGDMVLERLDLKVLKMAPEVTEWHCIRADHAAMAEAGQWSDLLDCLRFADQGRAAASGGKRVATLISRGARSALAAAIDRKDWAAAEAEIARFETVLDTHPDDYAAAHLLAQAHLDLAWAKRLVSTGAALSRGMWTETTAHIARAEDVLSLFDPIEEMSPILAATRYQLVRGIEGGRTLCRDWYEDWCDLDPTDADIHAIHAQHLLPHWFGTLANFDREAKHAARMTEGQTGNAAYAVFYMAAAEILGDFPPGMDIVQFLSGLADFQAATGCQYRANLVANIMVELMEGFAIDGASKSYELGLTRAALSDLLWNRLTEVHLGAWRDGATGVVFAINQIFGPAILRGARIGVRGTGLAAIMPEDRAVA